MDPETQLLIAKIAVPGVLGVAGLIILFRYLVTRKRQAWPSTSGKVHSASVARGTRKGRGGKELESYWAEVKYRYAVEDKDYENDKIAATRIYSAQEGPARNIVNLYEPEQQVQVWYNPADHSEAYLVPGGTVGGIAFLILSLGLLCADGLLTWWLLGLD